MAYTTEELERMRKYFGYYDDVYIWKTKSRSEPTEYYATNGLQYLKSSKYSDFLYACLDLFGFGENYVNNMPMDWRVRGWDEFSVPLSKFMFKIVIDDLRKKHKKYSKENMGEINKDTCYVTDVVSLKEWWKEIDEDMNFLE